MSRKEIGAFIYQRKGKKLQLMLVSNRKGTRWILPKGQPEREQLDVEVALDEAYEEAGIIGRVDDSPAQVLHYTSSTGDVDLHVYTMQIGRLIENWPERFIRFREMVDVDVALLMVRKKALRLGIKKITAEILKSELSS